MATTTLATVAGNANMSLKLVQACAGVMGKSGASVKAFTATAGTGNYPIAGLTLDLSGLFPNKILAVITSPLYDPAVASGDYAYQTVYVPSATGAPASGKIYVYAPNTGLMTADDTVVITGYVVTGFAIGY